MLLYYFYSDFMQRLPIFFFFFFFNDTATTEIYTLSLHDALPILAVGASFGAYHAACFGLRNPHLVNRIIGLSGLYDITRLTGGYSDANVYACNPFDFMRHEHDTARLAAFRPPGIILAVCPHDPACRNKHRFSRT